VADRRIFFLGDWHWLVREELDVLRLVFFGGTGVFPVTGNSRSLTPCAENCG
jgi:hypothetical protein